MFKTVMQQENEFNQVSVKPCCYFNLILHISQCWGVVAGVGS